MWSAARVIFNFRYFLDVFYLFLHSSSILTPLVLIFVILSEIFFITKISEFYSIEVFDYYSYFLGVIL